MNNCPNCGAENIIGSSFCVKCGSRFVLPQPVATSEVFASSAPTETMNYNPSNVTSSINNPSVTPIGSSSSAISINEYFILLLAVLLKPYTALKEEIGKFHSFKNSCTLAVVVSVFATILSLISTMLNTVRVTSYSFLKGYTTTWVWENLKEISYFKLIAQNLCVFLVILFAIAAIYYVGCLILKKQVNFSKFLGIASVSVVPMLLCTLFLAPFGNILHAYVGTFLSIIGALYTVIILYEAMNNEVNFTGDVKLYFNAICFSVIAFGIYFVYMKFVASASGLGSILDILK